MEVPENVQFCSNCGTAKQGEQKGNNLKPGKTNMKKIVIGLLLVAIFVIFGLPTLFATPNKAKTNIVLTNIESWVKLQQAYIVEHGKVGSGEDIGWRGYIDRNNLNDACKEKKCFSFYSKHVPGFPGTPEIPLFGIEATKPTLGYAEVWAELNEDLGKCKVGNKWLVRITDDGKIRVGDLDKSCQELTPNFYEEMIKLENLIGK
jgi:hypothetical protein